MDQADSIVLSLSIGAIALFWIGMLGLLWRRSLVGMLIGLAFAWISVGIGAIGFVVLRAGTGLRSVETLESAVPSAAGGALVVCIGAIGCLQVATGLALVAARIRRRGTLDADDAALLEG